MNQVAVNANILVPEDKLGSIILNYVCEGRDFNGESASVDPTFFETSGSPICSTCGENMRVFSAQIKVTQF